MAYIDGENGGGLWNGLRRIRDVKFCKSSFSSKIAKDYISFYVANFLILLAVTFVALEFYKAFIIELIRHFRAHSPNIDSWAYIPNKIKKCLGLNREGNLINGGSVIVGFLHYTEIQLDQRGSIFIQSVTEVYLGHCQATIMEVL